ncbi:MAG: PKD domain-containing protein [Flavobacteriales bacterium]
MNPIPRSIAPVAFLCLASTALAQPPCAGLIRPAFTYHEFGQQVAFVDSSITHNIAVVRSWNLGDGAVVEDSTSFTHYFPDSLPRNVCLTLTDTVQGQYCQTTFCRVVRTDLIGDCAGLVQPSFYTSDATANTMVFANSSTTLGATELQWEFGDNTTDTADYPDHTYLWPGRYYVSLNHIAYDQQNQEFCRSSAERWVAVDGNGATCIDDLFANFGYSGNGQGFWMFTSQTITSLSQVGTEVWSFGDETIGVGPFTSHQYPDPFSAHQVCMLTAATGGLQDTCYAYVCHTVQEATTNVEDIADLQEVAVWPNPFSDHLFVSLGARSGEARLQLIDALGQVVQRTTVANGGLFQWNLEPLTSGPYALRVGHNGAVRTLRTMHQ